MVMCGENRTEDSTRSGPPEKPSGRGQAAREWSSRISCGRPWWRARPRVAAELEGAESEGDRRRRLDTQIARLDRELAKLADWGGLLAGDGAGARRLLELVLDRCITFTAGKHRLGYDAHRVRIPLRLDRLFEGQSHERLASPTGTAREWSRQIRADSREVAA